MEDYDRAIELDPQDADAVNNRASAKQKLGNLQGAMEDYDRAIELDPQNAVAFNNQTYTKQNLGNMQGAMEDCYRGMELDPPLGTASLRILKLTAGTTSSLLRWAVVGAGPVGLALALRVADVMKSQNWDRKKAFVTVYETRVQQERDSWQRRGRRRGQVVTLQDDVSSLWPPGIFEGERVWPSSCNVAIRDLEDSLLEAAAQHQRIRIVPAPAAKEPADQRKFLGNMEADIIVAADGAASLCRRAFPETFRSPDAPQSTDRTRLGDTDAALNPVEFALGTSW